MTGALEVAGAALVILPKSRFFGAALLGRIMICAILTHLFVLHNAPTAAVILLVLALGVLIGRRADIGG